MYLSSGQGRTGDSALGNQDEIDLEFKGNEPMRVQSNVFFNGQENLQVRVSLYLLSGTGWLVAACLPVCLCRPDGFDCGEARTAVTDRYRPMRQMLELGFDSSADEHLYGIEWDANKGTCGTHTHTHIYVQTWG